jgi:hypothetical protein
VKTRSICWQPISGVCRTIKQLSRKNEATKVVSHIDE